MAFINREDVWVHLEEADDDVGELLLVRAFLFACLHGSMHASMVLFSQVTAEHMVYNHVNCASALAAIVSFHLDEHRLFNCCAADKSGVTAWPAAAARVNG